MQTYYHFKSQINLVICDSKNHIIPEKYDNLPQLYAITNTINELLSFTQYGTKIIAYTYIDEEKFHQQAKTENLSFTYNITFTANTARKDTVVLKYIKQFLKKINNQKLWSFTNSDDINEEVFTYRLRSPHNNVAVITSSSYWDYIQSQYDPFNIDWDC